MKPAAWKLAAIALAAAAPRLPGGSSLRDPGFVLAQMPLIPPPPPLEEPADRASAQQIAQLRSTIKSLTDALALANNESEVFKRQVEDLSLRLEALGIPGIEGDPAKIEGRLVAAVRDLRLASQRAEALEAQLVKLTEAVQLLLSSSPGVDPEARAALEAEMRRSSELLGAPTAPPAQPVEPSLTDAMVADVKPELSLVIANVGRKQGVRVGMPFVVWRDSRRLGEVKAVDVRDSITGAIIQSLDNEKIPIQKGDRLRVDAKR